MAIFKICVVLAYVVCIGLIEYAKWKIKRTEIGWIIYEICCLLFLIFLCLRLR